ncbi:MAG: class I SAM-dependent methyltransferase, partial [Candidatus Caldatribacterium sp.]|nr:class I SAM-dependent methyltransferase [Candidatus Caldatribacterium sp.]
RFSHVFNNPNVAYCEQQLDVLLQKVVPGKRVLEIGCYEGGEVPRLLAHNPQSLVGIDISPRAIAKAVATFGDCVSFYVADAHQLPFPDKSFDVVYGRAILHHLNYQQAIEEAYRILVPEGYAIFVEPLIHNPLLKLFRKAMSWAHTPAERPLSRHQIRWANNLFGCQNHYFGGLLSTLCGILTSLLGLEASNTALRVADRLDRFLLRTPLKWWARTVYLVWQKR